MHIHLKYFLNCFLNLHYLIIITSLNWQKTMNFSTWWQKILKSDVWRQHLPISLNHFCILIDYNIKLSWKQNWNQLTLRQEACTTSRGSSSCAGPTCIHCWGGTRYTGSLEGHTGGPRGARFVPCLQSTLAWPRTGLHTESHTPWRCRTGGRWTAWCGSPWSLRIWGLQAKRFGTVNIINRTKQYIHYFNIIMSYMWIHV